MVSRTVHHETILLVEPSADARRRLVQAATVEKIVGKIVSLPALQPALKHLRDRLRCDIVFISNKFRPEKVREFVSAAKNTRYGEDCAFIHLLESAEQASTTVVKDLLQGMDGFLASPFTTETVQQTVHRALVTRRCKMKERLSAVARLLLTELSDEIGFITYDFKHADQKLEYSEKARDAAILFRTFDAEELEIYYQVFHEVFAEIHPPSDFRDRTLGGPAPEAVSLESLAEALDSQSCEERLLTLEKLAALGALAAPLAKKIAFCLHDSRVACRRRAAWVLSRIGTPEALRHLADYEALRKMSEATRSE